MCHLSFQVRHGTVSAGNKKETGGKYVGAELTVTVEVACCVLGGILLYVDGVRGTAKVGRFTTTRSGTVDKQLIRGIVGGVRLQPYTDVE